MQMLTTHWYRARYRDGRLPMFDAVFTYSSVEHSGLGKVKMKNLMYKTDMYNRAAFLTPTFDKYEQKNL